MSAVKKPTRKYAFQKVTFFPMLGGKECCVEKEFGVLPWGSRVA